MEEKQFDKILRDKLAEHRDSTAADWNSMYETLRERHFFDEDTEIDHIIQTKLASFVDKDHTVDWDSFKADLIEREDTAFDDQLKASIQDIKASYQESHWSILHESLLAEAYKRKRIAAIKITELLVLLLFISGIFHVLPVKSSLYDVPEYRPIVQSVKQLVEEGLTSVRSIWSGASPSQRLAPTTTEQPINDGYDALQLWPASTQHKSTDQVQTQELPLVVALPLALIQPLTANAAKLKTPQTVSIVRDLKSDNHANRVFTLGGGVSHNIVKVPHVGTVGIRPSSYRDTDYTLSATYGLRKGKVEAFTGLGFYRVSYSPSTTLGLVNNVNGQPIPLSEIEKVNYSYMSIPLGVRVHALSNSTWSLYATTGINMDLKVTTHYDLQALTNAQLKLAESDPQAFGGDVFLREPFATDSENGLLQGGKLGDNLSLTAFVGVGISRKVTEQTALYLQPTFHKSFSLDGSGAQDERIDNLRVELGISTTF